jgi:exonuclease SbcD
VPFRFIHTADPHLDSPLRSLALRNADLAALIGNSTRDALVRVVDLCLDESVDALMIAGDLYDSDQTSMLTARFLGSQMQRLDQAGIRVFIIRGNHDCLSKITKELVLPATTKVFGGRAERVELTTSSGLAIAVHGISFAQPHAPESLLPRFLAPRDDVVDIGLLHTSLSGAKGHDPYAPCSVSDLAAHGFRYWGLGHIHVAKRATVGRSTIVMPGSPQGRDVGEAGCKSVSLVTVLDDGSILVEDRATSIAQFERVRVDVTGTATWRDLVQRVQTTLATARAQTSSPHLVARLTVAGATPRAWQVRRDKDLLLTEAEVHAAMLGSTWIDGLEFDLTPPARTEVASGALEELRRSIIDDICPSPAFETSVVQMIDELRLQLPPDCRGLLGHDEASMAALARDLSAQGCDDVLARLFDDEGRA